MKINKYFTLFIFLLACISLQAQEYIIQGKIVDENNNSISYCAISLLNKSSGTYTNENGEFKISIYKFESDTITISHLSFESKKISIKKLDSNNYKVILVRKNFVISEFVVESKVKSYKTIADNNKKKEYDGYSANRGITLLKKINPRHVKSFLKELEFYCQKSKSSGAKIALRIYGIDQLTGKPSKSLLDTNIVIIIEKRTKKIKFNLKKYNILIPETGIFVGIEFYGIETDNSGVKTPVTMMFTRKIDAFETYQKSIGGEWNLYNSVTLGSKPNLKVSYKILVEK